MRRPLESILGIPFSEGNHVEILTNGVEYFPAMLESIRSAQTSIDFLTFVYWGGEIADTFASALSERARNGVRVRVLLDAVGSQSMSDDLIVEMRSAGVCVARFRPLSWRFWRASHRTHRKILVCDGSVGFTGGVGIAKEWEGDAENASEWRDTHFKIKGPAVDGLRSAFFESWLEDDRTLDLEEEVIPPQPVCGPTSLQVVRTTANHGISDISTVFQILLTLSSKTLFVTAAYFVPDPRAIELLCDACRRGVDVRVLMPGQHTDSRVSQFAGDECIDTLLNQGVRIFRFNPTTLHAKIVLVDDKMSCIGSANFNQRSIKQDDEIVVLIDDAEIHAALLTDFLSDCERASELTLETWEKRSLAKRCAETVSQIFKSQV